MAVAPDRRLQLSADQRKTLTMSYDAPIRPQSHTRQSDTIMSAAVDARGPAAITDPDDIPLPLPPLWRLVLEATALFAVLTYCGWHTMM